jgi:hypothetical protein
MTIRRTLRRTFSTSSATFFALLALVAGNALASPSPARAETAKPLPSPTTALDGEVLRQLAAHGREGLSFQEVKSELREGDRISLTASVEVAGPGGKVRTGTVVFTAVMSYGSDGRFMDYTDDACTWSLTNRQAGADACDALGEALLETRESGIIMRDGGICDPIRHMGC